MPDAKGRAREALTGDGLSGMYDDYDQACQWAGVVADLLSLVEEQEAELDLRPPVAKSHAEQRGKFAAWRKAILGE